MGAWLERVVFSAPASGKPGESAAACPQLPFATGDYRTRQIQLTEANFNPALQASCSIPFVLRAVHDIPGAPPGAYWDGGITDYHLHLDYAHAPRDESNTGAGLVLYPHFQKAVVPGWLDKGLPWRHRSSAFLDNMLVLAPDPAWVATLPNGKLPDRTDFTRYGNDVAARAQVWNQAVAASQQLAEEFGRWLERPDPGRVEAL
jgi:predicted acylesterase/phospholipase RssA